MLSTAIGQDVKGKISPLFYCLGIGLSFVNRWIALGLYVAVALIWLVPDRRLERHPRFASQGLAHGSGRHEAGTDAMGTPTEPKA